MVLIDTNIAVSLWVENDWTVAARQLQQADPDWCTEFYALIEFSNVMATYVRTGKASADDARRYLLEAETMLGADTLTVPHAAALNVAIARRIAVYDARFLAAAEHLGIPLVTEDQKLRNAAPELTRSIAEALAAV
ncbi:MAG: type II toxin-antitoxin system VapC family toxin [Gammaproteobacteria bacterium]|nr:type II toxin-antitoxin system VapC family toxin [Gammaproteobacteria bacterium]